MNTGILILKSHKNLHVGGSKFLHKCVQYEFSFRTENV